MKPKWIVSWPKPTYSYQIPHQSYWELSGLPQCTTLYAHKRAWHPEEGNKRPSVDRQRPFLTRPPCEDWTLARGPLPVFHVAMGVDVKRYHMLTLQYQRW